METKKEEWVVKWYSKFFEDINKQRIKNGLEPAILKPISEQHFETEVEAKNYIKEVLLRTKGAKAHKQNFITNLFMGNDDLKSALVYRIEKLPIHSSTLKGKSGKNPDL